MGFGDIHPVSDAEYLFSLVSIVIASLFYAALISSLTSFLGNREVTTKRSRGELESIMRYMTVRRIPRPLQDRVKVRMINVISWGYLYHLGNLRICTTIFTNTKNVPTNLRATLTFYSLDLVVSQRKIYS